MKLTLLEKSIYFKGLLLLLRKDNRIADEERDMMMSVCDTMGFDKTFCKQAIDTLLENEYILDEEPLFSSPDIAKYFISDGFRLACSDRDLAEQEVEFLRNTSVKNGIEDEWFDEMLESYSVCDSAKNSINELKVAVLL
ncbi:MAG: hypothetical protein SCALA702_29150 [Melioribacteraceae bacterium]|nr:MAG: hypothetical protein SCALA702_29150 [Melioribacteraceae bacterium]